MLRINFIGIPVSNQQRAFDFYTEKLGFKVITDAQIGGGTRWIELQPPGGGANVLLSSGVPADQIGMMKNIAFTCDSVEKMYIELKDKGVEFTQPYTRGDWGGANAFFKDPDGNMFMITKMD